MLSMKGFNPVERYCKSNAVAIFLAINITFMCFIPLNLHSWGTKVEKMLTLAPERYTAGFHMVARLILWCI